MSSTTSQHISSDALRTAGTLLLSVRTLEQKLRTASGSDALSLTDIAVLGQIDRGVDLPSQVARALRLDPARVTHVTDRLVDYGYIERGIDPKDRRCWRLQLTESGTQRLNLGRTDLTAAVEQLLESLTDQEKAGLIDGLEGLRREIFTTAAPAAVGAGS